MSINTPKQTKNEKREAARQRSRQAREAEVRKKKRRRLLTQIGLLVGIVGLAAGALAIWGATAVPAGPGPENMATGGVVFDSRSELVTSPPQPSNSETRSEPEFEGGKVGVTVYVDYMCPGCGNFENLYGDLLGSLLDSGDIQLNVIPVTFLDPQSVGKRYSSRAANLIGCLANEQPDKVYSVHTELFKPDVQPQEGTFGLDDRRLLDIAVNAGAKPTDELQRCIKLQSFSSFFRSNDSVFSKQGVVGLADGERLLNPGEAKELQSADSPQQLVSTPTVIVDGVQWKRDEDFALFLEKSINANHERQNQGGEKQ